MIDFETNASHPISKLCNAGVINIPTLLILYPSPFNCFALDGSEEYNVIYYMHPHVESEMLPYFAGSCMAKFQTIYIHVLHICYILYYI